MKLYTIGLYIFSLAISLLMGDFAHAMELEVLVGHTQSMNLSLRQRF